MSRCHQATRSLCELVTKVCVKSIGTLCKILKNLKQFAFDGWYFTNYGFLRLRRQFSSSFCCKTGKFSSSKMSEKFWRFSKKTFFAMMFGTGRTSKLSWVRICDWFHDPTPLGEKKAFPSNRPDCVPKLTKVQSFDVTFPMSSNPF